ncbi:acyl-CoA carboxylase subunit epsilon (plasmid) [Streptomyces sp. NBC_00190]|uniref:acyl-CoA carboxylase subunit epsilon n=1 Tax=unclassified Streptomyces TaxID=2593676 RepID=UPI002E2A51A6|nr:acyl-CoA carboxylase subunit epsilon [Streptomyces sp. NBC_00190]
MSGTTAPALDGPLAPSLFKIINGRPTPEELAVVAALVTVLTARAPEPAPTEQAARWDRSELLPPSSWAART